MRQSNHDAIVQLIIAHLKSVKQLSSEALEITGRRFVTRSTFQRAMQTATRYMLDHDILNLQEVRNEVSICEGDSNTTEESNPNRSKAEST